MKKIGVIVLFFTALFAVSCGTTSNVSTGNSAATQAGKGCGAVLATLHSQYKSTGKIDMSNSTTLLNVVELGTYYTTLNSHKTDAAYKTAFATGLVEGSIGLITNANSLSTLNTLLTLGTLSSITSSTPGTSAVAVNVASGLINLLKSLK
jgi:hypothetical protein